MACRLGTYVVIIRHIQHNRTCEPQTGHCCSYSKGPLKKLVGGAVGVARPLLIRLRLYKACEG